MLLAYITLLLAYITLLLVYITVDNFFPNNIIGVFVISEVVVVMVT